MISNAFVLNLECSDCPLSHSLIHKHSYQYEEYLSTHIISGGSCDDGTHVPQEFPDIVHNRYIAVLLLHCSCTVSNKHFQFRFRYRAADCRISSVVSMNYMD